MIAELPSGERASHLATPVSANGKAIAESYPLAGGTRIQWSPSRESFILQSDSDTRVPTKRFHYDTEGCLVGVSLPWVDTNNDGAPESATY